MHELRKPAKPFCQNRFELDETIVSNEDSEEEDYHKWRQQKKGKDLFEELFNDLVKYNLLLSLFSLKSVRGKEKEPNVFLFYCGKSHNLNVPLFKAEFQQETIRIFYDPSDQLNEKCGKINK